MTIVDKLLLTEGILFFVSGALCCICFMLVDIAPEFDSITHIWKVSGYSTIIHFALSVMLGIVRIWMI